MPVVEMRANSVVKLERNIDLMQSMFSIIAPQDALGAFYVDERPWPLMIWENICSAACPTLSEP